MSYQPQYIFKINGQEVTPPRGWTGFEVLATFENGAAQANITTSELEFVNDAAKIIRNWIDAGIAGTGPGIFEGIPFEITITSDAGSFTWSAVLDMVNGFKVLNPTTVVSRLQSETGLVTFSDRAAGLTYQYLKDSGTYTQGDFSDMPYVVEVEQDFIQLALLSITTFLLLDKLAELVRKVSEQIATIAGIAGAGVTGPASAIIYSVAIAVINAVYAALIVVYLVQMIQEILGYFYQPVRYHKGIQWRKLFTKACSAMGYGFESSITDLDHVYYLPTKEANGSINTGAPGNGLPGAADYGYTVGEMFQLAMAAFDAKFTIKKINGAPTVFLEPLVNENFWYPQTGYTLPDVLDEVEEYNADELAANRLIAFTPDLQDFWTLSNWRGNSYEITTDAIITADQKRKQIKGFDEVRIQAALPVRKDQLNEVELRLLTVAAIADSIINFFGGSSNLAGNIQARVGMMKLSSGTTSVPKLVKYQNGNASSLVIAANYRDTWSAKYLYNNYHYRKSFVLDNYRGQFRRFNEKEIPFGFTAFLQLIENGFAYTNNGANAQVNSITWKFAADKATANYRVRTIFTTNLNETYREEGQ